MYFLVFKQLKVIVSVPGSQVGPYTYVAEL